jgi:hypothetical protein
MQLEIQHSAVHFETVRPAKDPSIRHVCMSYADYRSQLESVSTEHRATNRRRRVELQEQSGHGVNECRRERGKRWLREGMTR